MAGTNAYAVASKLLRLWNTECVPGNDLCPYSVDAQDKVDGKVDGKPKAKVPVPEIPAVVAPVCAGNTGAAFEWMHVVARSFNELPRRGRQDQFPTRQANLLLDDGRIKDHPAPTGIERRIDQDYPANLVLGTAQTNLAMHILEHWIQDMVDPPNTLNIPHAGGEGILVAPDPNRIQFVTPAGVTTRALPQTVSVSVRTRPLCDTRPQNQASTKRPAKSPTSW